MSEPKHKKDDGFEQPMPASSWKKEWPLRLFHVFTWGIALLFALTMIYSLNMFLGLQVPDEDWSPVEIVSERDVEFIEEKSQKFEEKTLASIVTQADSNMGYFQQPMKESEINAWMHHGMNNWFGQHGFGRIANVMQNAHVKISEDEIKLMTVINYRKTSQRVSFTFEPTLKSIGGKDETLLYLKLTSIKGGTLDLPKYEVFEVIARESGMKEQELKKIAQAGENYSEDQINRALVERFGSIENAHDAAMDKINQRLQNMPVVVPANMLSADGKGIAYATSMTLQDGQLVLTGKLSNEAKDLKNITQILRK